MTGPWHSRPIFATSQALPAAGSSVLAAAASRIQLSKSLGSDVLGAATPSLGERSADGKTLSVFYDPGFSLTTPAADGNKFVEIRTAETDFAAIGDMFINALGPNNQFGSVKLSVFAPVPEPGTFALMIAGVLMLAVWSRRRGAAKR